ncbi:uncharacterized protein ColSpa_07173 [Colletotrichum spaethianum]|uniref:Uncharacterized protein n=1 Tax=Colletotrichum spaethianum TaxID=700344 RepID=A0AA37LLR6_9PEZI|nr:uncharacterized protein ColSpa_07173 [Colletotrichum spaethianum]GKT46992.1 hypothetical protein ColSpa_07173 [Colletotrichum spaethianum]
MTPGRPGTPSGMRGSCQTYICRDPLLQLASWNGEIVGIDVGPVWPGADVESVSGPTGSHMAEPRVGPCAGAGNHDLPIRDVRGGETG